MIDRMKESRKLTHGWFVLPDRPGDRTLEQQLEGLSPLLAEVDGKSVLDVGCAEGLISHECARRGAILVHGIEFVGSAVAKARELTGDLPCDFFHDDANIYEPKLRYDIVLLLAVLHKLVNPTEACIRLASAAKELCVVRMGLTGKETIIDGRSGSNAHYIGRTMRQRGFEMVQMTQGPLSEETWYYRRKT